MTSMSAQQVDLVTKQFESQLAHYTSEKRGARDSRIVSFIAQAYEADAALRTGSALRVCEFGGADGLLLASIGERLGGDAELVNAELVQAFAQRQASPAIRFVPTSILDAAFPANAFDVVIARHVLHHLIADTLAGTRSNQARAFKELARITRPGGLVLIEEHVNPSAWSCSLLYHLSRFATKIRLRVSSFEITPHTVVAFLTPRDLARLGPEATQGRLAPLAEDFLPVAMPIQWRLMMLRRNSGNLFLAHRVLPREP
jgi:SAM-dependent methyltransferase